VFNVISLFSEFDDVMLHRDARAPVTRL
jgi:hypothetical protein